MAIHYLAARKRREVIPICLVAMSILTGATYYAIVYEVVIPTYRFMSPPGLLLEIDDSYRYEYAGHLRQLGAGRHDYADARAQEFFYERDDSIMTEKAYNRLVMGSISGAVYSSDYNFFGYSPCFPQGVFCNSMNEYVYKLLGLMGVEDRERITWPDELLKAEGFSRVIGCKAPKLSLTDDEVSFTGFLDYVGIGNTSAYGRDYTAHEGEVFLKPDGRYHGSLEVTGHTANSLSVKAVTTDPVWLYYADAWSPGWKVYVNGRRAPLHRANVAFKAVWLDEAGEYDIRFSYERPYFFALYGLLSALSIAIALIAATRFVWDPECRRAER